MSVRKKEYIFTQKEGGGGGGWGGGAGTGEEAGEREGERERDWMIKFNFSMAKT